MTFPDQKDDGNQDPPGEPEATFSPEQQTTVNNLIDAKYKKAYADAKSEYARQLGELTRQVGELQTQVKEKQPDSITADEIDSRVAERSVADRKAIIEELAERDLIRDDKMSEVETMMSGITKKASRDALVRELDRANCTDSEMVADLLGEQLTFRDGRYYIEQPGADGNTEFVTIAAGVIDFMNTKPHFKKWTGRPGTGSKSGIGDVGASPTKILREMSRAQIMALPSDEFAKLDKEQNLPKKGWLEH